MRKIHTKTGAASFYIVAFTTLLLSVIVVGFVTLVLSEMARTANNELSQSAYDSALAGVEDAKAAILNYQSCINQGAVSTPPSSSGPITCGEIIWYMENNADTNCDVVAHILSRIGKDESKEVLVEETTKSSGGSKNNMQQAYTCVTLDSTLEDYRSTITESRPSSVVKVQLDGASVKEVKSIRLSWYSDKDGNTGSKASSFSTGATSNLLFPELKSNVVPIPPVVTIQLLQTATTFSLDQFDKTEGSTTNRGTLYLVPTTRKSESHITSADGSYFDVTSDNRISSEEGFLKSNDKTVKNVPFAVNCPADANTEYACSVSIGVPNPVGGDRSEDTFMFVISSPYQHPDVDFKLEVCGTSICETYVSADDSTAISEVLPLKNVQTKIDSTGRANDLYRRVEVRVEQDDTNQEYAEFAMQLLNPSGTSLDKEIITTIETND